MQDLIQRRFKIQEFNFTGDKKFLCNFLFSVCLFSKKLGKFLSLKTYTNWVTFPLIKPNKTKTCHITLFLFDLHGIILRRKKSIANYSKRYWRQFNISAHWDYFVYFKCNGTPVPTNNSDDVNISQEWEHSQSEQLIVPSMNCQNESCKVIIFSG